MLIVDRVNDNKVSTKAWSRAITYPRGFKDLNTRVVPLGLKLSQRIAWHCCLPAQSSATDHMPVANHAPAIASLCCFSQTPSVGSDVKASTKVGGK